MTASVKVLAACAALLAPLAQPARGLAAPCTRPHPNVILIVADDLWSADLPFFSPPVDWGGGSPPDPEGVAIDQRMQRPDLNRFSARLQAIAGATTASYGPFPAPLTSSFPLTPVDASAGDAIPDDYLLPCDEQAGGAAGCRGPCEDPACGGAVACPGCDYQRDVLRGFGGLGRVASGAAFTRFYASSAYCAPARSSILTGRQTRRTGVGANGARPLQGDEITIAEWLQQGCPGKPCFVPPYQSDSCTSPAGGPAPCYTTGLIGKWHLGRSSKSAPWAQGFDRFIGSWGAARDYVSGKALVCGRPCDPRAASVGPPCTQEVAQCEKRSAVVGTFAIAGDRDRGEVWACNDDREAHTNVPGDPPTDPGCRFSQRVFAKIANEFIETNAGEGKSPFFLVLSLNALHTPRSAPNRTIEHYKTRDGRLTPSSRRHGGTTTWALLEEIDASIGKIFKKLEQKRYADGTTLASNTVVLFTGDQGGVHRESGMPLLRGGKGGIYEGGIRVGLLASACGVDAPKDGALLGSHVDLLPTIAEAAGMPIPASRIIGPPGNRKAIDGVSLYPHIAGPTAAAPPRDFAFARYNGLVAMSRRGVYQERRPGTALARGVCASRKPNERGIPILASSCTPCSADAECAGTPCHVVGKVCAPIDAGECHDPRPGDPPRCSSDAECLSGHCVYEDPDPDRSRFQRCSAKSDCGSGSSCQEISVRCESQCAATAWKLFSQEATACAPHDDAKLFELATNPEEDERLDCRRANPCAWKEVLYDLNCRLQRWHDCSKDNDDAPCVSCSEHTASGDSSCECACTPACS